MIRRRQADRAAGHPLRAGRARAGRPGRRARPRAGSSSRARRARCWPARAARSPPGSPASTWCPARRAPAGCAPPTAQLISGRGAARATTASPRSRCSRRRRSRCSPTAPRRQPAQRVRRCGWPRWSRAATGPAARRRRGPGGPAWVDGLAADVTPAAVADLAVEPGAELWFVVKATEVGVHAGEPPGYPPAPRRVKSLPSCRCPRADGSVASLAVHRLSLLVAVLAVGAGSRRRVHATPCATPAASARRPHRLRRAHRHRRVRRRGGRPRSAPGRDGCSTRPCPASPPTSPRPGAPPPRHRRRARRRTRPTCAPSLDRDRPRPERPGPAGRARGLGPGPHRPAPLPLDGSLPDRRRPAPGVTIYVLDTGVDATHPEFEGRAATGANAVDDTDGDCDGHGTSSPASPPPATTASPPAPASSRSRCSTAPAPARCPRCSRASTGSPGTSTARRWR